MQSLEKLESMSLNRNPIAMARTLDSFSTNKEYEKHVIEVITKIKK
jgi:formyltetrahydrofolate synthetase